jgi:dTDP-4-dehydrorhamnose reductase
MCESDHEKAYSLNVTPVKNIVKVVLTNNLKMKLIQISTDHVYDKTLSKENETKLVNYYAESKYLADEFSQLIEATVLRTNFFGHSQSSKVSFSDWIIQSLENKKPLNGFIDVFFNPLHLSTLVSEIARVVDNFHSGIYNLGSNEGLSKYQFMIELARHKGFSNSEIGAIKYSNSSIGIPRPFDMRTDVSKYESIFKTKLPTLLKEIQKC